MVSLDNSIYFGCLFFRDLVIYLSYMFETLYSTSLKRSICLMFAVCGLIGSMVCCVNEIWMYIACVAFWGCNLEAGHRRYLRSGPGVDEKSVHMTLLALIKWEQKYILWSWLKRFRIRYYGRWIKLVLLQRCVIGASNMR